MLVPAKVPSSSSRHYAPLTALIKTFENILYIDEDECKVKTDKCESVSASCVNEEGSYRCDCKTGFERKDNYTGFERKDNYTCQGSPIHSSFFKTN